MAIVLERNGDRQSIDLRGVGAGSEMRIDLDWNPCKPGFLARALSIRTPIDLDLGCFYELRNGRKTLIDGLQFSNGNGGTKQQSTKQGCYVDEPYIWHTGDDRGEGEISRESLLINLDHAEAIKRMVVYAFIFDGDTQWNKSEAKLTISVPGRESVEIRLDKQRSDQRFCVLASIDFREGAIDVEKLMTYHRGHSDCDAAYCWGFKYRSGEKE